MHALLAEGLLNREAGYFPLFGSAGTHQGCRCPCRALVGAVRLAHALPVHPCRRPPPVGAHSCP